MIRIDWVQLCETAFLDDCDRLCMIGIMTRFPAPQLPIAMRQIMIVVRIAGVEKEETFAIGVSMVTPDGVSLTPQRSDGFDIAIKADYIFITLRDIPLDDEGTHRFTVTVGKGDPVFIDIPVRLVTNSAPPAKARSNAAPAFGQPSSESGRAIN
jgi:hypothetical protein